MNEHILTRELATKALSGMQEIQKALVEHGDSSLGLESNLLLASDGRAVWIDFDKAEVYDHISASEIVSLNYSLQEVHMILFDVMVC